MAAVILEEQCCVPICVSVRVGGGIDAKCPGMIGTINIETETMNLVRCLCSCHNEDSEFMNEEQEQWFKERMGASMWGRPFKPCSQVEIGLKWIES